MVAARYLWIASSEHLIVWNLDIERSERGGSQAVRLRMERVKQGSDDFVKINRLKQALRRGELVVGSEISRLRSTDIPRIYAAAGLDFLYIDMEHSSFSMETVADMIEVAHRYGIVPLVRVPQAEYAYVSRALDAGASGIIVPRVNDAKTVRNLVQWTYYPPIGVRGFACTVGQSGGEAIDPASFVKWAHENTILIIQFERQEAIDNIEEMLSIEGVDVACLGYMDLTVDLGCPGELNNPKVVACVQKVADVAKSRGIASGIITPTMSAIEQWVPKGYRFVCYSTAALMLESYVTSVGKSIRKLV